MTGTRWGRLLALVAAGALTLTACGGDGDGGGGTATEPAGDGGSATVEIEARDNLFSPSTIQATSGEETTVTVSNTGQAVHTFTIEELDVDVTIDPGSDGTATFTASESGTLQFVCRFHEAEGMVGTIQVG
jgi:plastocyanin